MRSLGMTVVGGIAATLIMSATPIHSEDYDPRSGHYQSESGQNLSVLLKPLSDRRYAINIATTVLMEGELPGCGGSIDGELAIEGDVATLQVPNEGFVASGPVSQTNLEYCRIDLRFLDSQTIRVEEISGCSYYHGAGCSFSGDVVHEASGI